MSAAPKLTRASPKAATSMAARNFGRRGNRNIISWLQRVFMQWCIYKRISEPQSQWRGIITIMDFQSLPYDIRHLIYRHIFPPTNQIYIQSIGSKLIGITPDHKIPTALLRTNNFLHKDSSEYLYNTYLFNIIGTKSDCLRAYPTFLATTKKHSRAPVRVDCFSNGMHAATACLSIQAGIGKLALLQRRERGVPIEVAELEREVRTKSAVDGSGAWNSSLSRLQLVAATVLAVAVALLSWLLVGPDLVAR